MPSSPAALTADSRLSTDYLLAANILVDTSVPNPLATLVLPDGTPSALVILAGSGLNHLTPDSSSASGWTLTPLPQGTDAQEVAAGVFSTDGKAHAYYRSGDHTLHSVLEDTGWSDPEQLDLATNLTAALKEGTNELGTVVGISGDGNLTTFTPGNSPSTQNINGGLFGAQIVVNLDLEGVVTVAGVVGSKITVYYLPLLENNVLVRSIPDLKVSRLHFVYLNASDATMLVYSDPDNALWFVSFPLPNQQQPRPVGPTALNATVQQGVGLLDSDTLIHFFGVSPDGSMWVLNQLDWDANAAPEFAQGFPLDVNVSLLAAPPNASDTSTLFALGVDQTLHILTQDMSTQLWTRNVLLSPTPDTPLELPRYRTELSVTDDNGSPFQGAQVTLSSTVEVAILNGGTTFFVGPDDSQTVTLTSDALGKVTFSYPATGLSAPIFTAAVSGTQLSLTVTPHQYLHDFLQGNGPLSTGSTLMSTFDSDAVQNATVNGQPLVTNDASSSTVDCVVASIKQVLGQSSGTTVEGAAAGLAVDLRDPRNPRMTRFSTAAQLEEHRAMLLRTNALGSVWSDITQFFEDVWYALKTGALAVAQWVIDSTQKVITFTVQLGEDFVDLAAMAVDSVEDAVSAVHAFFQTLGADIRKVLDWLKDLFAWGDIWNTKLVMEHLVQQVGPVLEWALTQKAAPAVKTFFDGLQDTVDGAFTAVINQFSGTSIAAGVSPDDPSKASSQSALTASVQPAGTSSAQHSWLTSKLQDNVPSGLLDQLTGSVSTDVLAPVWAIINDPKVADSFSNLGQSLGDFFTTLVKDPAQLPTRGIADLLTALKSFVDLVLEILEDLIEALISALEGNVAAIWSALSQALPDIPVISWLWSNVLPTNGATMSLLGLGMLALAFPVTVLSKLANDNAPPFDADTTQQLLAWTFQAPQQGGTNTALLATASVPSIPVELIAFISLFQGVVDALTDAFSSAGSDELANWAATADLLINLALQALSLVELIEIDLSNFDVAQGLTLLSWIAALGPLVLNSLALLPLTNGGEGGEGGEGVIPPKILESIDSEGKVFLTLWGALMVGIGVAAAVVGMGEDPPSANEADLIAAILAPGSNALQFLRLNNVADSTEGFSVVAKVVLDVLLDVSAGFVQLEG